MRRFVPLVLALALLGTACGASEPGSTAADGSARPDLTGGDPLPEAELTRLDGDGVVTREDLAGTPTVINFWASWCPYCIEEMPGFEEVHQDLAGQVQFLGVDREDSREKARVLAEETGVTYTLVEDPDGSYFAALRGRGMPTTVFVDASGTIQYRHAGPLTADQLRDLIEEHLGVDGGTGQGG